MNEMPKLIRNRPNLLFSYHLSDRMNNNFFQDNCTLQNAYTTYALGFKGNCCSPNSPFLTFFCHLFVSAVAFFSSCLAFLYSAREENGKSE